MLVYKLTNRTNSKVYIGQTVRSLDERLSEHVRKGNGIIGKAIAKYGIENFDAEVLCAAETVDELNAKEIEYIAAFACIAPSGYNQCDGGGNTKGYRHRESSKRKMAVSKREKFVGERNPFYGKRHTDEARRKMSEKRKGMAHLTEEQIRTLRESHRTRKVVNLDTGEIFRSVNEAAEVYGAKPTHITRVCRGRRKRTAGYRWEYSDG